MTPSIDHHKWDFGMLCPERWEHLQNAFVAIRLEVHAADERLSFHALINHLITLHTSII